MRTRRFVNVVFALVLSLALLACGAPPPVPTAAPTAAAKAPPAAAPAVPTKGATAAVRLGYIKANYADVPLLVAMREKLFEQEGLSMEYVPFSVGRDAVQALVAGSLDVAVMASLPLISSTSQDEGRLVVIGVCEYYGKGTSVVVRKDLDAKTPADLRGKKVGTFVGSSTHNIMVTKVFPAYGLQTSDYQVVNLPIEGLLSALSTGAIDAFVGTDPHPIKAELTGVGKIILDFGKFDPTPLVYVAHRSFVQANPDTVTKFMTAAIRGNKMIQDDLPRVSRIMREIVAAAGTELSQEEADGLARHVDPSPFYLPNMGAYLDEVAQGELKAGRISRVPDWSKILLTEHLEKGAAAAGMRNPNR